MHRQRDRADSFGGAARAYDRHRPRYPAAMFDELVVLRALDVGAGTGITAVPLAERGVDVLAVEPDSRMAELAKEKGVTVELATFEDWDDTGRRFDLILFGQSFHWVDPAVALPKVRRLLTDGGRMALAWNRQIPITPSMLDFAAVYRDFLDPASPLVTGRPTGGTGSGMDSAALAADLEKAGFAVEIHLYPRDEHLDAEQWLDMAFTYSNHLVLEPDQARELRSRLAELIGDDGVHIGGDTLLMTARPV
ncbi:class I SAM-dependent methyltransferase [Mycobacterium sp. OTB74]|uniref:class I SAM-dependent methyltransferase n=1 Tax=Mycobacterium sp. OTB74 TaxID=1853452 RepID=UPI0032AEA0FE